MKTFIGILCFSFTCLVHGQTEKPIENLDFVSKQFKVPSGCSASSPYQLQCPDFTILWLYMNQQMLQTMPDQAVNQLSSQLKGFKKKPITTYLLGDEAKGYKISFKNQATKKTGYQIVAFGTANGQPVLVQVSLPKEPNSDDDLPEFVRLIVRLSK